jgi:hypothetical protein
MGRQAPQTERRPFAVIHLRTPPGNGSIVMGNVFYQKDTLFFFAENPLYLQAVYVRSASWCEDWVLWLGEGHSVVPFCSYYG